MVNMDIATEAKATIEIATTISTITAAIVLITIAIPQTEDGMATTAPEAKVTTVSIEGAYSNQGESSWDYEYSRTYRFGVSIGADNSNIDAGNGDNNINLNSIGGELAIALAGSSISAGSGDDVLTVNSLAEGEDSYVNRSKNKSQWNYNSRHSNRRSEEYSRSYASAYYWYDRISEYTRNYESESDGFSTSRSRYTQDYDYSRINRNGTAYGARESFINLGDGDNQASISANGGRSAEALSNSTLETGKGNDVILLSATALGENSVINRNQYLNDYNSQHAYNSKYSFQGITNHAMARDGGAQPGRTGHSTSTKEHPKTKGKVKASGTVTMKIPTSKS